MAYQPTDVITSEADIREIIDGIHDAQKLKVLDHIDTHKHYAR